ncbi:uncharacterized protein LOC128557466 [Mercenaria mercenaria]|uniref:uncharacterized protein LOC128557466 n=1 Tax=Mercenaria mercenaria TaxID=6596 RepID=UPI00234EF0BE|nr:uncharacterized protein LOC128557466 [Mercenaria mercenaria]
MDLGMTDGAIEDHQISASSWHTGFPPNASRPFYQGWCADPEDKQPYIIVDLREVTKVEAITLWNWKETFTIKDNAAERDKSYLLGVDQLAVSYGNNKNEWQNYNNVFYFDKSRVFDEPQTLWFMKPFMSRYVRLHIIKPITDALGCMRFELQGCRIIGNQKIVPTMYLKSERITPVSFMQSVQTETIISTIRYPSIYDSGTDYVWLVKYPGNTYIKLIFVDISLRKPKVIGSLSQCNDSVIISKTLPVDPDSYRVFDYQYNGMSPILETSENFLVMTFTSCLHTSKKQIEKMGFKAIIAKQDIPACFRIDSPINLQIGRRELCLKSSMSLSPMSFLGFPFLHTTEEWTITSPRKRIQLNIIAFQVGCKIEGAGSDFKIIDSVYERQYCNLQRPPNVIKSHSDKVVIVFKREEDHPHIVYTTGFRIIYNILQNVEEQLITYVPPRAKCKYM